LKRQRIIGFILAIVLGLSAALMYGWVGAPAQPANTTLASLRSDYKTDFVLMVAEAYPKSEDLPDAIKMLRQINPDDPLKAADEALVTGQQLGYSEADLRLLVNLDLRVRQYGSQP
jgi:hypothetical protein